MEEILDSHGKVVVKGRKDEVEKEVRGE